jgi:hypothetical protein
VSKPGIRAAMLIRICCFGLLAAGAPHAALPQTAPSYNPNVLRLTMEVSGFDYVDHQIPLHVKLNDTMDGLKFHQSRPSRRLYFPDRPRRSPA